MFLITLIKRKKRKKESLAGQLNTEQLSIRLSRFSLSLIDVSPENEPAICRISKYRLRPALIVVPGLRKVE